MAEQSIKKRRPERKPRVAGGKPSLFGKDVRSRLRKAKFKHSRKKVDETEEEKEAKVQRHLPPPQPKIRTFSCDESERDEESEEEFLSYVKATVSDDRTYNFKDDENCSLGCCKSCGLLSHDLANLKTNVHKEFKHCITQLNTVTDTIAIDENNASGDLNVLNPDKSAPSTLTDLKDQKNCKKQKDKSSNSEIDNLEDELDSLLTLKEPISKRPILSQVISNPKVKEPSSCISATVPTKSVDLEKWLESVLDV